MALPLRRVSPTALRESPSHCGLPSVGGRCRAKFDHDTLLAILLRCYQATCSSSTGPPYAHRHVGQADHLGILKKSGILEKVEQHVCGVIAPKQFAACHEARHAKHPSANRFRGVLAQMLFYLRIGDSGLGVIEANSRPSSSNAIPSTFRPRP